MDVGNSAFTAFEMRSQKVRPFGFPAIAHIKQAQAEVGIARVVRLRFDGFSPEFRDETKINVF